MCQTKSVASCILAERAPNVRNTIYYYISEKKRRRTRVGRTGKSSQIHAPHISSENTEKYQQTKSKHQQSFIVNCLYVQNTYECMDVSVSYICVLCIREEKKIENLPGELMISVQDL